MFWGYIGAYIGGFEGLIVGFMGLFEAGKKWIQKWYLWIFKGFRLFRVLGVF